MGVCKRSFSPEVDSDASDDREELKPIHTPLLPLPPGQLSIMRFMVPVCSPWARWRDYAAEEEAAVALGNTCTLSDDSFSDVDEVAMIWGHPCTADQPSSDAEEDGLMYAAEEAATLSLGRSCWLDDSSDSHDDIAVACIMQEFRRLEDAEMDCERAFAEDSLRADEDGARCLGHGFGLVAGGVDVVMNKEVSSGTPCPSTPPRIPSGVDLTPPRTSSKKRVSSDVIENENGSKRQCGPLASIVNVALA